MELNLENHPCFNEKIRHTTGRVHLPVAPRCNIQCRYCSRKCDCVNESRPGVTSVLLKPYQALAYLDELVSKRPNIAVVGIAGPGDPFANPAETMETLRLVRAKYPAMLLCVSSNGLGILPYVEELAALNVSHVTITINSVDPAVGEKIYAWIRPDKKPMRGLEAATTLMNNQLAAVQALVKLGVMVKINAVVLPGINDAHIPMVAKTCAALGATIFNCIPYFPSEDAEFGLNVPEPSKELMTDLRAQVKTFMPLMQHCQRCRADAAGLLGEKMAEMDHQRLEKFSMMPLPAEGLTAKTKLAVASREGIFINQHLGEADAFLIYENTANGIVMTDRRKAPPTGGGNERWKAMAATLADCYGVVCAGAGVNPIMELEMHGIMVHTLEGMVEEALTALFGGQSVQHLKRRANAGCRQAECAGTGGGCS